jgi:hypothetical protein
MFIFVDHAEVCVNCDHITDIETCHDPEYAKVRLVNGNVIELQGQAATEFWRGMFESPNIEYTPQSEMERIYHQSTLVPNI